jgi:hypothetical protein
VALAPPPQYAGKLSRLPSSLLSFITFITFVTFMAFLPSSSSCLPSFLRHLPSFLSSFVTFATFLHHFPLYYTRSPLCQKDL